MKSTIRLDCGQPLLTVYGHVERVETKAAPVVHLITATLADHSPMLRNLAMSSRDLYLEAANGQAPTRTVRFLTHPSSHAES